MQKYNFKFTLKDGQTGIGTIEAPNIESVGMVVRERFKFAHDVRVFEVSGAKEEEVDDESTSTVD